MKTATQINVRSLIAALKQARRLWKIRELKRLWWEEIQMIRIAKRRHWHCVLARYHAEQRYQFVKRLARYEQTKGAL
ncbi:hypothetical protein [Serratia sp. D1N4]